MIMNCKEATQLISQGQERKLSLVERLGLKLHVLFCAGCRASERQLEFLRTAARRIGSPDA